MSWKHFAPVPQDATLSFGGYSFIHPKAWEKYLDKLIREDYPDYFAEQLQGRWNGDLWRDQESCILTSLENYLFHEFGVIIPEENLFKVFNKDGKGLELSNMLEAISAVIEPLGLEIERVLAVDPEIRAALGESDRMIDETQNRLVAGKPGLCMINVEDGYSHAFFWRKIDPRGFKHRKFRLVILIKKRDEDEGVHLSAVQSLKSYLQYFLDSNHLNRINPNAMTITIEKIHSEIQELEKACHNVAEGWDFDTRAQVDHHLASLLAAYQDLTVGGSPDDLRTNEQSHILLEAGQVIRRVVREGIQAL